MTSVGGKHAIITGGSSGIGLAVARALAARQVGAVTLMARGRERLEQARGALEGTVPAVGIVAVDVSDASAVHAAMSAAVDERGPCDILVTSAGLTYPGHFADLREETFRELMEVNYFGTLYPVRAAVPSMVERRSGAIVGVSSTVGLVGVYGYAAYAPTKYAVRGLLETLRIELAPHGVSVGCAFPPDTETAQLEFEEPLKPAETRAISGSIKPIRPERVAETVVRGIETGKFWLQSDLQTRLLSRAGGLVRGPLAWDFDRRVRKARRAPER